MTKMAILDRQKQLFFQDQNVLTSHVMVQAQLSKPFFNFYITIKKLNNFAGYIILIDYITRLCNEKFVNII